MVRSTGIRRLYKAEISECENDSATSRLERIWFAAHMHAEDLRAECAILQGVMEQAQANWRETIGELASVEALRDELAAQYEALLERRFRSHEARDRRLSTLGGMDRR